FGQGGAELVHLVAEGVEFLPGVEDRSGSAPEDAVIPFRLFGGGGEPGADASEPGDEGEEVGVNAVAWEGVDLAGLGGAVVGGAFEALGGVEVVAAEDGGEGHPVVESADARLLHGLLGVGAPVAEKRAGETAGPDEPPAPVHGI